MTKLMRGSVMNLLKEVARATKDQEINGAKKRISFGMDSGL